MNSNAMEAAAALEIIIYLPSQSLRTTHSGRAIFHQNASQHAIPVCVCSNNHTTVHIYGTVHTYTHTHTRAHKHTRTNKQDEYA